MTELVAIDYLDEDAGEVFAQSLHDTGFGVLKNHPIRKTLVEDIYSEWLDWFLSADKQSFHFDPETQAGWFPAAVSETAKGAKKKDIKEYFHYYPGSPLPTRLRANIETYYQEANTLAATLLKWVQDHTPDDIRARYRQPLPQMIEDSDKTLLRVLHYPPMTGREEPGAVRAAAHGDINLLTILPASRVPGLQVMRKDESWLDVPSDFGTLIVNIGDMLQEASGGYYPSTIHRVINPTGDIVERSRISLPLFLHPRPDVVLSDRYTADEYLEERLRELGVK